MRHAKEWGKYAGCLDGWMGWEGGMGWEGRMTREQTKGIPD